MDTNQWESIQFWLDKLFDLDPSVSTSAWLREQIPDSNYRNEVEKMWKLVSSDDNILERPLSKDLYSNFPSVGDTVADFYLEKKLGQGSFGIVFLAEQKSLNRKVALKISPDLGEEGRTMATIEHENIVRVFSEGIESETGLRFLCMQYVAGVSLESFITNPAFWNSFNRNDMWDWILEIGEQLSLALAKAHEENIFHLDVKPANILLSKNGVAYLTDFNVALNSERKNQNLIGGTYRYMPPEQREYLNQKIETLDERADLYSLGKVLIELLEMAPKNISDRILKVFESEIFQYLHSVSSDDLNHRPSSGLEMATVLKGFREKRILIQKLPAPTFIEKWGQRFPFLAIFFLLLLPSFAASVVNISHNAVRIVGDLNFEQRRVFSYLVYLYNSAVYLIGASALLFKILPISKGISKIYSGNKMDSNFRRKLISSAQTISLIPVVGWLSAIPFFPALLSIYAGPLPFSVFAHFFFSNALAAAIAITYGYYFLQIFILRALYPLSWVGGIPIKNFIAIETLSPLKKTKIALLWVGLLPSLATLMVVGVGFNLSHPSAPNQLRLLIGFLALLAVLGLFTILKGKERLERLTLLYQLEN